ncbi:MAG: adenine deaminase C-terminal domain-containing protein [Candidatus Margulisiibacteriota bacterium]|nr:adenine deaminase C-terminal domain-containing protein [Candidatus Margulisiibacteriota bacterium]
MNGLKERMAVSRGEKKAGLVLKNGQLINVFSGEIYPADVAIHKERIAGVGDYSGEEEIDLNGRYVAPGFIDGHVHIESSLLTPPELAHAVVPHGTTTVIAGPHEIVNIMGEDGFKYIREVSAKLPLDIHFSVSDELLFAHEATTAGEAKNKLRSGSQVLVREGSSAKNMEAIIPLIDQVNQSFFCFCTDDIYPADLEAGHLNEILKKAVSYNFDPMTAIRMVTINPARFYGLTAYGVVAPGYFADINVLSNLEDFGVDMVFKRGKKVAAKGRALFEVKVKKNKAVRETMHVKPFEVDELQVTAKSDYAKAIEIIPGQTVTKAIVAVVKKKDKLLVSDPGSDILKVAVVERHRSSGRIGIGLVKGFGLKKGAIATSFAHNAHNIVCVGVDDEDMISAIRRVERLGGGKVVVSGGLVLGELPLPIAGLMSDKPLIQVAVEQKKIDKVCADFGSKIDHPFGALSFLTLADIPELKITANGLMDVNKRKIVDLFE